MTEHHHHHKKGTTMTETPQSREDWERERDESESGQQQPKVATGEGTVESGEGVEIPDNDAVEPGNEPQPESADGTQDDPEAEPVVDPEPGDDERDKLGR